MAVFKCKMCGANLEVSPDMRVGTCGHCGSTMTLPHLDSTKKENLYNRANHMRQSGEFDKAAGMYELILNEDPSDAEAYWSLVMCRYGIEYVEDPKTKKRVPTCNRTQRTPIFADEDYKMAIVHADAAAKEVYEAEAKAIDEIQKGILAISEKEAPFDVFICYKETDAAGKRTPDSVLAQELYYELTELGYKVFFAKITLENKLGTEYEPYIFAALNSAAVMVALGTRAEYLNAPWVKNEWSRYLALINAGHSKALVPAYKDMDPYDLPEEFSHLQAQDMGKLGFMQDLVRGISKIVQGTAESSAKQEKGGADASASSAGSLLERAYLFLEDGDFLRAEEYFERVLDAEPRNAKAYFGKMLVRLKLRKEEELNAYTGSVLDNSQNFQKAVRFADEEYKKVLETYGQTVQNNIWEIGYKQALLQAENAEAVTGHLKAAARFEELGDYKDARQRAQHHLQQAEDLRRREKDQWAKERAQEEKQWREQEVLEKEEQARIRKRNIWMSAVAVLMVMSIVVGMLLWTHVNYVNAQRSMEEGNYEDAIARLDRTTGYRDSSDLLLDAKYNYAKQLLEEGEYVNAAQILHELGDYRDSETLFEPYRMLTLLYATMGDYVQFGSYEQDNNFGNGQEPVEWLVLAKEDGKIFLLSRYVLDVQPFSESTRSGTGEPVCWYSCTLRTWMNNYFCNALFSLIEQDAILTTFVQTPANPNYGSEGGEDCYDRLFLLSIQETEAYLTSQDSKVGVPTEYTLNAIVGDKYTGSKLEVDDGEASWWLRSIGYEAYLGRYAANMYTFGSISYYGTNVINGSSAGMPGVRPAMWVDLNAEILQTLAETGKIPA